MVDVFQLIQQASSFCATCLCQSPGDCMDWGGVVAGLGGLAAAAASGKFGSPNAGFKFMNGTNGKGPSTALHAAPSSASPVVSQQPFGIRLPYRDTATDAQGTTWYEAQTPDGHLGWVTSDDVSTQPPVRPLPMGPPHLTDTGPAAEPTGGAQAGSARG